MKYKKIDYNDEDLEQYTHSDLKKICDYWLRQYLLNQNKSDYYLCPLKGRRYRADKIHVAHFIDRQCMNTRYNLDNCNLISSDSNTWDAQVPKEGYKSLHHYDYEEYLIKLYGKDIIDRLYEKSQVIKVYTKQDYIDTIMFFKNG